MACKRINKRVILKILAIGLFFAGLWLLTYSHVIYVEEQVNGQSVSSDESFKVKMMDDPGHTYGLHPGVRNKSSNCGWVCVQP